MALMAADDDFPFGPVRTKGNGSLRMKDARSRAGWLQHSGHTCMVSGVVVSL